MKLWDKGIETDKFIEQFTVGKDRELDLLLARFDIIGSIAHIIMLESIGLISMNELHALHDGLIRIYKEIEKGHFIIEEGIEDVHSQVELLLTRDLGDTGKKIHSARSRNDQVLLDIKLFIRDELQKVVESIFGLFNILLDLSNRYKQILMPGYTHLQIAMPSSFGLWFAAYAESLTDDMQLLLSSYHIADQNPLGSAAGYGSSFPVNRQYTTDLLGFSSMNFNVVNAQMSRGKTERIIAFSLASIAGTLSRIAGDICLFSNQNFGFIAIPDELTTGSSIMPHKKNPDVFELLRGRCNKIQALPGEIDHILINLPFGYNRDMQVIKESFLPVFSEIKDCIEMMSYAVSKIIPADDILSDEKYRYIFSVEEVNKLVMQGMPFRDAYKKVASEIKEGLFRPARIVEHNHEGSIGNLCNDQISYKMESIIRQFDFEKKEIAYKRLLKL
jgi:argininosuccinate lyase